MGAPDYQIFESVVTETELNFNVIIVKSYLQAQTIMKKHPNNPEKVRFSMGPITNSITHRIGDISLGVHDLESYVRRILPKLITFYKFTGARLPNKA